MNRHTTSSAARRAFTLLEVLLTVSMSVVLMALIGGAIQFYARDLDVSDMDIRQVQLAAAILQMVEDDLRSTIYGQPPDMEALAALLSTVASTTGGGAPGSESTEDLSAAGIDSEDDLDMEEEILDPPDLTTGVAILQQPGLIGNQFQLQIDVSRLPRLEEYILLLDDTATDLEDVPSDIKTVSYYVQDADVSAGVSDALAKLKADGNATAGGLVRRSLDRAATTYAAQTGGISRLAQTGDLLAPEVLGIEFEYYDGVTWLLQWSSDEYDALPLAVRVRLTMSNPVAIAAGVSADDENAIREFTHIVRLPMAKLIEQEESTDELSEAGI